MYQFPPILQCLSGSPIIENKDKTYPFVHNCTCQIDIFCFFEAQILYHPSCGQSDIDGNIANVKVKHLHQQRISPNWSSKFNKIYPVLKIIIHVHKYNNKRELSHEKIPYATCAQSLKGQSTPLPELQNHQP